MTMEQAEPGGVGWTNRSPGGAEWSWSALKPTFST
jgi:hypothetical protein